MCSQFTYTYKRLYIHISLKKNGAPKSGTSKRAMVEMPVKTPPTSERQRRAQDTLREFLQIPNKRAKTRTQSDVTDESFDISLAELDVTREHVLQQRAEYNEEQQQPTKDKENQSKIDQQAEQKLKAERAKEVAARVAAENINKKRSSEGQQPHKLRKQEPKPRISPEDQR